MPSGGGLGVTFVLTFRHGRGFGEEEEGGGALVPILCLSLILML